MGCTTRIRFMRRIIALFVYAVSSCIVGMASDDAMRVEVYTTQDGLSHRIIFDMTQDSEGYLWLATWNGLCRYDSFRFETFNMLDDSTVVGRLHTVTELDDGRLACIGDNEAYLFDRHTGRFQPDTIGIEPRVQKDMYRLAVEKGALVIDCAAWDKPKQLTIGTKKYLERTLLCWYTDRQGNLWVAFDDALYKLSFTPDVFTYHRHIADDASPFFSDEIRAFRLMRNGYRWISTKNGRIYIYDASEYLKGYFTPDGRIVAESESFAKSVYAIEEEADGTVWIATKGEGLFCCIPQAGRDYKVVPYNVENGVLSTNRVYDVYRDTCGRLWVAGFNGGVSLLTWKDGECFSQNLLPGTKVRYITALGDDIAVATTTGLYVFGKDLDSARQLCSHDVSYVCRKANGETFVATMEAGLFRLAFDSGRYSLHPVSLGDCASDVIMSLAVDAKDRLWLVCDNKLVRLDADGDVQQFDQSFFHSNMTFSEAHPCVVDGVLWVGCAEGWLEVREPDSEPSFPPLYWKSIQAGDRFYADNDSVVTLGRGESIIIDPVAIDFRYPGNVKYAYRVDGDSTWHIVPADRYIRLSDLSSGKHRIEVRSTDCYGIWIANNRTLIVTVEKPGRAAVWLSALAASIVLLLWFVRKRNSQKAEESSGNLEIMPSSPEVMPEKERFLQGAVACVEARISDVNFTVDDLAGSLGISRTVLYKQMKDFFDLTPAAFIRDIRLKRAKQLLQLRQYTVSEVAFMTGFSDAKYFSKVFKKEVGKTPVEYSEAFIEK